MRKRPGPKTALFLALSLLLAASAAEGAWPFAKSQATRSGYLGVSVQNLTPALREALDLESETGILVNGVQPDSPAERAGIEVGDVLLTLDGEAIESPAILSRLIRADDGDKKVKIRLLRKGKKKTVKVTIGAIEETRKPRKPRLEKLGSRVVTGSPKGGAFLGVRLHDPDENLASYFDFPDEGGALVLGTEEESPAGEAGIVGGDVIIRFGDEKIGDSHDLVRIVGESEAGDEIELFLIRKGKKKKVRVTLGEGEARSWVRRHTGQFRELDLEKLRPFGNRLEEDMEQLKKELIELKRELMRMKKER